MMEMSAQGAGYIMDVMIRVWSALTIISVAYVVYDQMTSVGRMRVMKWSWVLATLYTGPVGLVSYLLSSNKPESGTHVRYGVPLWKQSVEATFHCLAGCSTGVVVAVAITSLFALPLGIEAIVEYVAGFVLGLFIFQALLTKEMVGCSYGRAVKISCLGQWLSMNAVMSGMIPVMVVLMSRDMQAMEPVSLRFWGILSLASIVGAVLSYPVNWWLISYRLHPGMDGAKGETRDPNISAVTRLAVTLVTLVMLAGGVAVAARYGDFTMHTGKMKGMPTGHDGG
ncbi:MAG: DUF4396 domain-containing protein [Acidobacteriota bacterium]|nr:DUF4396 domain-containing protein [Acidobacteriota bacterium]